MQYSVINKKYEIAVDTLIEELKFLEYIASLIWPQDMLNIIKNQLSSTVLDVQIVMNLETIMQYFQV